MRDTDAAPTNHLGGRARRAAAVAATVCLIVACSPDQPPTSSTTTTAHPALPAIVATVPIGNPRSVAFDGLDAWATASATDSIDRIDSTSNLVTASVPVGTNPQAAAFGMSSVWVAGSDAQSVTRVDPVTETATATIALDGRPAMIAVGGSHVWVAAHNGATTSIAKIDPTSNTVIATIPIALTSAIAYDAGSLWATNLTLGTVTRISGTTNALEASIPVGQYLLGIAATDDGIWVASRFPNKASLIDPASNSVVTTVPLPTEPGGLAVDGDSLYVTGGFSPAFLTVLDSQSGAVTDSLPLGDRLLAEVALGSGTLWVVSTLPAEILRIDL